MHAATHILQEKTHACGVLKRHNFWFHVSLGSAETLVRRGGIVNHQSIAYSVSNISAKNYRNRLMWVESIVCNTSVVFLGHSVQYGLCSLTQLTIVNDWFLNIGSHSDSASDVIQFLLYEKTCL